MNIIRRRTFFCTLLIVAILFSSLGMPTFGSAAELAADTTVFTGKFEHGDFEGTSDEVKVNWPWIYDWSCFALTTAENHTPGGSQCLEIKPTGGAWQSLTYKDNNGDLGIEIIPGAKYRFSFWHKGAANGQLQVGDWGLDGNITGYKTVGQADADWTYYSKEFTANARTRIAPIDLKNTVDGATAGASSYFDDFNIEMISPPQTPKPPKPLTEDETLAGKRENMEIGTNFWFHTSWSDCTPMKDNVNWATAYANGDNIWNETFIKEIEPFTTLRFMDWNNTNGSTIVNWSERRLPTDPGNADIGMSGPGIAYEWMIDLCNRYDKNPWVCLPSSASDDYMREVAKVFKEKLEPGRKLYIEYSNEVWNGGFQQYGYCENMGKKTTEIGLTEETKFTDNYNANYYVYRSFQMFNIFEDVYGYDEMGKSCIRICATSGNTALFDAGYENVFYSKIYNPRDQRADYLAVAPYVGSGLDGNHMEITTLFHDAIDSVLDSYVKSAYNMGKKYGLPLMAYEGGQHLLLGADAWSRNPEIYAQYIYMLNKFAPYFELYCHYCLTGAWGSGGSWGANAYTGQPIEEAHKLRALYDWIKAPTNEYEKISFPEGAPGNASFQDGMNYWDSTAVEGTVNVVTNSTDEEDVNHPHYLSFTCTNSNNGGRHVETVFRLEPGETYTMKYDVICRVPDRSGTRDFNFYIYDYETNERLGGKNWSSTRWATMTIDSFTVPAGGNGLVKIRFSLNSWDPSGSCTMEGKVDNFRVYKVGEAEPSNPQLPTGTYVYQRAELPKITPLPRVTPSPTATTKPTVKPTQVPTPTATPKPTVKPTATATPVFEDNVVYSADFNNGTADSVWGGYSVVDDPKDTTNKVISYTENNWKSKLTEALLSGCDPNQIYTIMFKVYGDAAHVALSYGQGFEIVATSNDKETQNGIVTMDRKYYQGLYVRPVANEWNTYVATFKGYSQYKLYLMTQCDNNVNGGTALFDDIKIYKGDYFAELMEQIENSKPTATPDVTPSTTPSETPKVTPSAPVDQPTAGVTTLPDKDDLALAKESAKAELRKYVNLDDYADAEKKYINDFLAKADKDIDAMTSIVAIAQYLDVSKKVLDKVMTAAELEALGAKKVKKVKFVKKKVKLKVGKQTTLKVKLTPKKLSKAAKKVKWSIDKKGKKVVKFVKKANKLRGKLKVKIKALKKGKAKITCKAPSGKKAVCSVIVK